MEVVPGVPFGNPGHLFSPAFWQVVATDAAGPGTLSLRLGSTLIEEVCACLLGGYGMPAELGIAAFKRLRDRGLLQPGISISLLVEALQEPFRHGDKTRRYRFPNQKAKYLAATVAQIEEIGETPDDVEFRNDLSTLPGVGLKTASWVVRNIRLSNRVAVLDVHVVKAGRYIGLFDAAWTPSTHYQAMERRFLEFATNLSVGVAILDAVIWRVMRALGHLMPAAPYPSHYLGDVA